MGKLTDKLEQVSQSSGSNFGFFGRARADAQKPRPAALLVSLRTRDAAQATAAAKAGADAIILSDWRPGTDVSAIASALGTGTLWGVWAGAEAKGEGTLKAVQDAGASFAVVDASSAASLLFEELEHFDRIIALELPKDDMGLMMIRSQNLLPVQVGLATDALGKSDLAKLTVADYLPLKLAVESLRYPVLATLRDVPDSKTLPVLVRIGFGGVVLAGEGTSADALGTQMQSLREALEATPARRDEGSSSTLLGGLVSSQGSSLQPEQPAPEREPEQE